MLAPSVTNFEVPGKNLRLCAIFCWIMAIFGLSHGFLGYFRAKMDEKSRTIAKNVRNSKFLDTTLTKAARQGLVGPDQQSSY